MRALSNVQLSGPIYDMFGHTSSGPFYEMFGPDITLVGACIKQSRLGNERHNTNYVVPHVVVVGEGIDIFNLWERFFDTSVEEYSDDGRNDRFCEDIGESEFDEDATKDSNFLMKCIEIK